MKKKAHKTLLTAVVSILLSGFLLLLLLSPHVVFFFWDGPTPMVTTEFQFRNGYNFNDLPKLCTMLFYHSRNDLSRIMRLAFEIPVLLNLTLSALLVIPLYLLALLGCSLYPIALLTRRSEAGQLGKIGYGAALLASLLETGLHLWLCFHCHSFAFQTYPSVTALSFAIPPVALVGWLWAKRHSHTSEPLHARFFRHRLYIPALLTAGLHLCHALVTAVVLFVLPYEAIFSLLNVSFYWLFGITELWTAVCVIVALVSLYTHTPRPGSAVIQLPQSSI